MSYGVIVSDGTLLARANEVEGAMYRQSKELGRLNSVVKRYKDENATLRELVDQMYSDMQGVLDMSTDTVFVDSIGTLRDKMDWYMQVMNELGMQPADYEKRMRELGMEVES